MEEEKKFDPLRDVSPLVNYLDGICPYALGCDAAVFLRVLQTSDAQEKLMRFMSDATTPALLVQRIDRTDIERNTNTTTFNLHVSVEFDVPDAGAETTVVNLAFVKRFPVLDVRPIHQQVLFLNLGQDKPFETFHSYVHSSFIPLFNSYTSKNAKYRDDPKAGVQVVKKRMAELELSLLSLQQEIEIPDISITMDPEIDTAVARARKARRKAEPKDLGSRVENSQFLENLQKCVQSWIHEIKKVTGLTQELSCVVEGSVVQEISFWQSLDRALQHVVEITRDPGIDLTMDILKLTKRFHYVTMFETDTHLKPCIETVGNYLLLIKEFPINQLLAATDVDMISAALTSIFNHMRKLRNTRYPVARALKLVEALSRDFAIALEKVLSSKRLLAIPFTEFEAMTKGCFGETGVFNTWVDLLASFREMVQDITSRRRGEARLALKVETYHSVLEARVEDLAAFRENHNRLAAVVSKVLPSVSDDISVMDDLDGAYRSIRDLSPLDVSAEGVAAWNAAMAEYDQRVDDVEGQIIEVLLERLASIETTNEMFRAFSKFNALFFRPKIRGAVQEYQARLIDRVKTDIRFLQDKFKTPYRNSETNRMSNMKDLPPLSGQMMWAKQIERTLDKYMRRVEAILGKDWEQHVEGQKMKAEADSFRAKLDTTGLFENWVKEVEKHDVDVSGKVFVVSQPQGGKLTLAVNYDPKLTVLFKEVRNLQTLNKKIPFTIQLNAKYAQQAYPKLMSLNAILETYYRTCASLDANSVPLVAGLQSEIQSQLADGFVLQWESHQLETYVKQTLELMIAFEGKAADLREMYKMIDSAVESLKKCRLTEKILAGHMDDIQRTVDSMAHTGFSNLGKWVRDLDLRLEEILLDRLVEAVDVWIDEFKNKTPDDPAYHEMLKKSHRRFQVKVAPGARARKDVAPTREEMVVQGEIGMRTLVHEVTIKDTVIALNPPLEEARSVWVHQLNVWMGVVTKLKRPQSSRVLDLLNKDTSVVPVANYNALLKRIPLVVLEDAYGFIEDQLVEVNDYLEQWLNYQSLWDTVPEIVHAKTGDKLMRWQLLLKQIREDQLSFKHDENEKSFGPIIVDYELVQSKVVRQYDMWHKSTLAKFGMKIGDAMRNFHGLVSHHRGELEKKGIETNSTAEAVAFVLEVAELKKQTDGWAVMTEEFRTGQALLEEQEFVFPKEWIHFDTIEGEWSAFSEILGRKDGTIVSQMTSLQRKIEKEDQHLSTRTSKTKSSWQDVKQEASSLNPAQALELIESLEKEATQITQDFDRILVARKVLNLEINKEDSTLKEATGMREEMSDLKKVYVQLQAVWQGIATLRSTPWKAVITTQLKSNLNDLVQSLKSMPNQTRQYEAWENVQQQLAVYLKHNDTVSAMKDGLKERHWKKVQDKLDMTFDLDAMVLGDVWDLDFAANGKKIMDIVSLAQGENSLENFITEVREFWSEYEVELVQYQTKCKLIRGWDDLFNKLLEHLNSLNAMKGSPFYKFFMEPAEQLDEALTLTRNIFDLWQDVQRRWVYLAGIFSGSEDIKVLLPQESSKFAEIDSDFTKLMRKVDKNPLVFDIIALPGLLKKHERTKQTLQSIQKALSEYLERQRAAFPRFYFVGDEDLLEIIGNSKDISKTQKHLKKMFAGLSEMILETGPKGLEIVGIVSGQGERLLYTTPIVHAEHTKIDDWLRLLEEQMMHSLADNLRTAVLDLRQIAARSLDADALFDWVDRNPGQLVTIGAQVIYTETMEAALAKIEKSGDMAPLQTLLDRTVTTLENFADAVLLDLDMNKRKKFEHMMMEYIHERDVMRQFIENHVSSRTNFDWLYQTRFYYDENTYRPLERLVIKMSNATFFYGYEYLGIMDKLVHTPLTDRAWTTLTQALEGKMGGAPFGPAGTGKTESVKALGAQLGRFVLVFNCDENFDFQSMGRIFVGLCQVGAWGCFDEFNRLTEKMLSAVSQQIQTMQEALAAGNPEVELLGNMVPLSPNVGVFITMNPGYAGRSNLPDNLKQLVRSIAMTAPDKELIGQVMLFSQGFKTAERLSGKVVPLFKLCKEQVSNQSHYDFGLRSLKSVLISAGRIKRRKKAERQAKIESGEIEDIALVGQYLADDEQLVVIEAVCQTIIPKLVSPDIPLFTSLLSDVFPGASPPSMSKESLKEAIIKLCKDQNYVVGDLWLDKTLQLANILSINHGVMLVGPSGAGKSVSWRVLLQALELVEGVPGVSYVIDPKAITVTELYGQMDPTTREWTDGLLTSIIRSIIDNARGQLNKRHWIIFDGDVDALWVENMNSTLDDNKLLTLPTGERLALPPCVRIMFEVQDLVWASPATVSRTGMVWYSEETVTNQMLYANYMMEMKSAEIPCDVDDDITPIPGQDPEDNPRLVVQKQIADVLAPFFAENGIVEQALEHAYELDMIMDCTRLRLLNSLFSLVKKSVGNVHVYNKEHEDDGLSMTFDLLEAFFKKIMIWALVWSFSGACKIYVREEFGDWLNTIVPDDIQFPEKAVLDYQVSIEDGEWSPWSDQVPVVDVDPESMGTAIIPTLDTIRHTEVLFAWLFDHKPILLCGPPGSGKTMTLFSALKRAVNYEMVAINFSATTGPALIMETLEQKCSKIRTGDGYLMQPKNPSKWIVMFCDEINLPEPDEYKTVVVLTLIRQMIEQEGYWDTDMLEWISLKKIQFCGACNPPTDPGRTPLSHRFLRWAPLVLCDYPAYESLTQIYGTFTRGLLRDFEDVAPYAAQITDSMVDFYTKSQRHFTPDQQQHYIYSPRELTRWVRGIYAAIKPLKTVTLPEIMRLWAHEALRLFADRLVTEEEHKWTNDGINASAAKNFPSMDLETVLRRPILFSNWLSEDDTYRSVDREPLREYLLTQLQGFMDEQLDVKLVLFNEVLDNVLRINRTFNQKQGHVLMIGQSGAGKTVLSRFVAWMNNLEVFMIRGSNKYSGEDFDNDLRIVLRRSGAEREGLCFIFDESNIKGTSFLERMNTLLANGEIPGLFEGDEYTQLMNTCKQESSKMGLMLDSADELYDWFTEQIILNLHVVFTLNPAGAGWTSRKATSPALFNRCVLNWYGDWTNAALYQVGYEFTEKMPLEKDAWQEPEDFPYAFDECPTPPSHRVAVVNALVYVHISTDQANQRVSRTQGRENYVTPRHFLDMIGHFMKLVDEKKEELIEQQNHLNGGLSKLIETEEEVKVLQVQLAEREEVLKGKSEQSARKLKDMMVDKQEAQRAQKEATQVSADLAKQQIVIDEAARVANVDLDKAKPALAAAQQAVGGVKKKMIQEVTSLGTPPPHVVLAASAVATLFGQPKLDWNGLKKFMKQDVFLRSLLEYDTKDLSVSTRNLLKKKFVNNPEFDPDRINQASRVCGPLAVWVIAQVTYSEILEKVEPLQREVDRLNSQAQSGKNRMEQLTEQLARLDDKIGVLEAEYAEMIKETNAIKAEMEQTQIKVARSSALLDSLGSERVRWGNESQGFASQMETVVGDCLICAAVLAYGGFFDQQYRNKLTAQWKEQVQCSKISFKEDVNTVSFLSIPDDRLKWQANGLPNDDLCSENAIMIMRYNRFPLLIDPSGQAAAFVMEHFKDLQIQRSSFLDKNLSKTLETSLRFGTPVLVNDAERLDPIVNPILNKEVRKHQGRVLVSLGELDIDFSSSFQIILTTRDPTFNFAPDVCSRVTFVNFTITPASLQAQCLSRVLKVERPDVDKKRSDMLKLQGEFRVVLRNLEDRLLKTLSESEGNILNNNVVIETLETLKKETNEIKEKVEQTNEIMNEISVVSGQYEPVAASCSRIYFSLEQLSNVHFLYQFSLDFFLQIFEVVLLHNDNLKDIKDYKQRLDIILRDLFTQIFKRVARALAAEDQICFALLLAQIRTETSAPIEEAEFEFFLKGTLHAGVKLGLPEDAFTAVQIKRLRQLATLPAFKDLGQHYQDNKGDWQKFMDADRAEECVPDCWAVEAGVRIPPNVVRFRSMILCQLVRPDRLLAAAERFVASVFSPDFTFLGPLDLEEIVFTQTVNNAPILLCAAAGFDASAIVEDLAETKETKCVSVSIGSPEGFELAEKAIAAAGKLGTWVMLKNVHLAPQWLVSLEKKLTGMEAHAAFRIFMTSEINPKLPVNLLRGGRILLFEPPPGVKANLLRSLSQVPDARMNKEPAERSRLYFLISWLHAVLQERLRYTPLGFAQTYEFNDADRRCAFTSIDYWLESVAKGKKRVKAEAVPWPALRCLLSTSIYGGKVDNVFDCRLLESFMDEWFAPGVLGKGFTLVRGDGDAAEITIPDLNEKLQFEQWAMALPDSQTPLWLGLPANAEKVLLANRGTVMVVKFLKMQSQLDDDDDGDDKGSIGDERPAWMRNLHSQVIKWTEMMPPSITKLVGGPDSVKNPLFRCIEREIETGSMLLKRIADDLRDLDLVMKGEIKQTNHLRMLLSTLSKGQLPPPWTQRYAVPSTLSPSLFLGNFVERCSQLERLSGQADYGKSSLNLGLLFVPEAFVTASAQAAGQSKGWSLEDLRMTVHVGEVADSSDPMVFQITNMLVEGVDWKEDAGALGLCEEMSAALPPTVFRWSHKEHAPDQGHTVNLPVYLNQARSELMLDVNMPAVDGLEVGEFSRRGVGVLLCDYTKMVV